MKTSELDFRLPGELIATKPAHPRDAAKLLVLERETGQLADSTFQRLADFLEQGDVLVFNKTKVFPARVFATKDTGGKLEVVFLREVKTRLWEVLIGGKVQDGQGILVGAGLFGTIRKTATGNFLAVNKKASEVFNALEKVGHVPLPPYIKRKDRASDKKEYQTVFAEKTGSAAAPTASLHFTKKLMAEIKKKGVEEEFVTLHVGLGTFAPVKTKILEDHTIHSEYFEIDADTAGRLTAAKKEGRRIIAVGTTVVRVLESASTGEGIKAQKGTTNLFIYPGYKFKAVKGLVTNFHTPKSSLLGLVFAFAGKEATRKAYKYAIKNKYRFYSYGDGMLIFSLVKEKTLF